jgi:hypothetical protein
MIFNQWRTVNIRFEVREYKWIEHWFNEFIWYAILLMLTNSFILHGSDDIVEHDRWYYSNYSFFMQTRTSYWIETFTLM